MIGSDAPRPGPSGLGLDYLFVGVLLVVVLVQAGLSLRQKSMTFDELTYIPAGYSYVTTGDYRMNPEHPPLIKLLGGAALLPLGPALDTGDESWAAGEQWDFARHFFATSGVEPDRLVTAARMPIVALTALLVLVAWLFATALYGRGAGLLAAWLCAFSPTLLAHGRLLTTDLALAFFVLLTAYGIHRLGRRPTAGSVLLAGCALGLALATKYSAVMLLGLVPAWAGWAVWRGLGDGGDSASVSSAEGDGQEDGEDEVSPRPGTPVPDRAVPIAVATAGTIALALLVVTLTYRAPGRIDIWFRNLGVLYSNVVLDLPAYFAGSFHEGRMWTYFLRAFFLKTPTAFLVLLGLRAADQIRRRDPDAQGALFLLLPAALWLGAMSATALPFGVRYILPVYPLLFVWVSGLLADRYMASAAEAPAAQAPTAEAPAAAEGATSLVRPGLLPPMRTLGATVFLGVLFAAGSLRAWPDYLPYFNVLAGGPTQGIQWLDDSNVDWGQDLPALRAYLEAEGIEDAVVVPMGAYDPALYAVPGRLSSPQEVLFALTRPDPPPGVYAVSAHILTRARWGGRPPVDPLTDLEPAAVLGHSLYVFRFQAQ